jgi:hypothetical protein
LAFPTAPVGRDHRRGMAVLRIYSGHIDRMQFQGKCAAAVNRAMDRQF